MMVEPGTLAMGTVMVPSGGRFPQTTAGIPGGSAALPSDREKDTGA